LSGLAVVLLLVSAALARTSSGRERSLIHPYWVSGQDNLYGEMRPFMLGEKRGAALLDRHR